MSNVGNITTRRPWESLVSELVSEFRKWDVPRHDIEIPAFRDAERAGKVEVRFLKDGEWYPVECKAGGRVFGVRAAMLAILQSVTATRKADQRGIGSVLGQVVSAVAALPPARNVKDPHAVLGVAPGSPMTAMVTAYRNSLKTSHPDGGGSPEAFKEVQEAGKKLGIT